MSISNAQPETAAGSQNVGAWGIRNPNGFILVSNTWEPKRWPSKEAADEYLAKQIGEGSATSRRLWAECEVKVIPPRINALKAIEIVNAFREIFFRDYQTAECDGERDFLNPRKEWNLETAEVAAAILEEAGLVGEEVLPFVDVELM